jgi:hypothetical protein
MVRESFIHDFTLIVELNLFVRPSVAFRTAVPNLVPTNLTQVA